MKSHLTAHLVQRIALTRTSGAFRRRPMYENCDLVRFSSPFTLLALHNPRSGKVTPGKIALTRQSRTRDTPPMHEIDGLVRYARAASASRSPPPPQSIQPQICCKSNGASAAKLRLYGNSRERRTQRPGQTAFLLSRFLNNGYTTANLLQLAPAFCSIFAVVYESGERSTHMTREKQRPSPPSPQASGIR